MKLSYQIFFISVFAIFISNCTNPFAPKLDTSLGNETSLISDLSNIEGIFNNLRYAYTFRDTTIYGELLSDDFTFTYRDYESGIDQAWGREDEMRITYAMFNNTERLDLIWNNIVAITSDSANVIRSFSLTVTFNPTDVRFVDGKVNLQLRKSAITNKWQIITWIDESNF
jgi:hypothetical protein